MTLTPLAPGVWVDQDGAIHMSLPELLAACGWPDDETHRARVLEVIREVLAAEWPGVPIIEVE